MYATDLKCNPVHGPNDEQFSLFNHILSGAAILSAAYNTAKAVEIATREWEMAKKYWRIARNWLDHYRNNYAPVEDQELAEAMALEDETPQYRIAEGRAKVAAMLTFRGLLRKSMMCTSKYCTGLRQDMITHITSSQADALALAEGMGYRNERAYLETRDDVRFQRQLGTAKRGRDMVAGTASMAKASANIYGDLFDQAWAGLTGAGQYLGYELNRNRTRYPTSFINYDSDTDTSNEKPKVVKLGVVKNDAPKGG